MDAETMDASTGGLTGANSNYPDRRDDEMVNAYLCQISQAIHAFDATAQNDGRLMDIDSIYQKDEALVPEQSSTTPEALAKSLLSVCRLPSISGSAATLPKINPIERECDLPEGAEGVSFFPYQRRRVDYLRDILRAMAPIQLDVASHVCTLVVADIQATTSNDEGSQSDESNQTNSSDMKAHERCVAAWILFSFWLPVAPQIAQIATHLFSEKGFHCPLQTLPSDPAESLVLMEASHLICQFYLAYLQDYESLISFWNWSPVFSWLPDTDGNDAMEIDADEQTTSQEHYVYRPDFTLEEATLWHTVRTISYTLNLSPSAKAKYIRKFGSTMYAERVPWVIHPFTAIHEERLTQELMLQGKARVQWWNSQECENADNSFACPRAEQIRSVWALHPFLVNCGQGRLLVRNHLDFAHDATSTRAAVKDTSLVRTQTTKDNLVAVASILCISPYPPPVLICGPAGAGKSSLIRELARMVAGSKAASNSSDAIHDDYLLEIHVDQETDTKTLIGCYTTTDIPGEFAWRPGALTVAVREGKWVLLEDLDSIPVDIQAALVQLLKDRLLPMGNGKVERCHPNFRMFATLQTMDDAKNNSNRKVFQEHLWMKVHAKPLPLTELRDIALGANPKLPEFVVDAVLHVFRQLDTSGRQDQRSLYENEESNIGEFMNDGRMGRSPSVRDLLKVMSRISTSVVFEHDAEFATETQRLTCLYETVDVFAGAYDDKQSRREFIRRFAAPAWNLTIDLAVQNLESRTPKIQHHGNYVQIGRTSLGSSQAEMQLDSDNYACTGFTVRMMESISSCIRENEAVLLVGETGGGKTSILQQLARISGRKLVVQNLSLQTDSTDILGGFRPLEIHHIARRVYQHFVDLFTATFSRKQNEKFLQFTSSCVKKKQWDKLSKCFARASKMGLGKIREKQALDPSKQSFHREWKKFVTRADRFEQQRMACETGLAFEFSEGILVEAIRDGKWILLDECNLASSETLQRLCGLLDDSTSSITLTERGDSAAVERHPDFRLFAAMNPATDAGKKDLPPSIRSRFTELYVDEILDPSELRVIAARYIGTSFGEGAIDNAENSELVGNIVDFYLKARNLAEKVLVDGSGHKPRYTLRSLTRALLASKRFVEEQKMNLRRALVEGFELTFQGSLDDSSSAELVKLLESYLSDRSTTRERDQPGRNPGGRSRSDQYVLVKPFWLEKGPLEPVNWSEPSRENLSTFVLTPATRDNLRRLARGIAAGPWPILLEGPTSAGKTTLVEYTAALCGQKVIRINNHEHTDIQEYTGGFTSDDKGKLAFYDGLLVQALRNGNWVILDELNLAPTEVLEALNRLLDDNRELYLPEINEVVKAHPSFRLFATQNPSGAYGGRKPLSKAFRNRFLEMYVGDIPPGELVAILEKRAGLAPSYAKTLVATMKALRRRRNAGNLFMGQDGFMTPRDLLRWAHRGATSKAELAREGYMLLAERLREDDEKSHVLMEIQRQFKVQIDLGALYFGEASAARNEMSKISRETSAALGSAIAPTKSLLRLMTLVLRCVKNREPVLLVGETGAGKTTVVQLLAHLRNMPLHVVNCHATTETSDLLGGLRPVRGRSTLARQIHALFQQLSNKVSKGISEEKLALRDLVFEEVDEGSLSEDDVGRMAKFAAVVLKALKVPQPTDDVSVRHLKRQKTDDGKDQQMFINSIDPSQFNDCKELCEQIASLHRRHESLFEWSDGPLVQAMKSGDYILLDEMSLAEDAVLERLNSVLEPGRSLVLAEKGDTRNGDGQITAKDSFQLFATMNPGGDFGKRELSPALRSRFTEIWVPPVSDMSDIDLVLKQFLAERSLDLELSSTVGKSILSYVEWFNGSVCGDPAGPFSEFTLSLRDILAWVSFVEACVAQNNQYPPSGALFHGACLTHLDGLGLGTAMSSNDTEAVREQAKQFLQSQDPNLTDTMIKEPFGDLSLTLFGGRFGIQPFTIPIGPLGGKASQSEFNFHAPTTSINLARILRGMQLSKPILLEGSPGVGKTTLISALAASSGHNLVRINLSEQTDMTDLLGSDMPTTEEGREGQSAAGFKWIDGVLLSAIKSGDWVLLDELNLASQSVLEGLNSILDHRASVFIPEIGETVECPSSFRVFAAQNPLGQGGGRKGLPKSFLNRFTKVYVEALTCNDQHLIVGTQFPSVPKDVVSKMIAFNGMVHKDVVESNLYGHQGSPWEFNLRDIFRWCELIVNAGQEPHSYAWDLYVQRMRVHEDREQLRSSFCKVFNEDIPAKSQSECTISDLFVTIGDVELPRIIPGQPCMDSVTSAHMSSHLGEIEVLRALARCVQQRWPCILVGSGESRKDDIVVSLAKSLNANVVIIDLTPSSDVSELLGSFEQASERSHAQRKMEELIDIAISHFTQQKTKASANGSCSRYLFDMIQGFNEIEKDTLCRYAKSALHICSELNGGMVDVRQLSDYFHHVSVGSVSGQPKGHFEWKDGALVQAMEKGDWVYLRNANLCPSSVLDRLNGLLEPGGELLLLECGTGGADGSGVRTIKCHPNFRVVLSMDAANGEVSRAMRNRCVEICVDGSKEQFVSRVDGIDALAFKGLRVLHEGDREVVDEAPQKIVQSGNLHYSELTQGLNLLQPGNVQKLCVLPSASNTVDAGFNSSLAEEFWTTRVLQLFWDKKECGKTAAAFFRIVCPEHLQAFGEKLMASTQTNIDSVLSRLLVIFLLKLKDPPFAQSLSGVEHSLARNWGFLSEKIMSVASPKDDGLGGYQRIVLDRLYQMLCERVWLNRPEASGQSVLQTSLTLAEGRIDGSSVACSITPLLHPFFQTFDTWFESTMEHGLSGSEHTQNMHLLVNRRDQLWNLLQQIPYGGMGIDYPSIGFDYHEFVVQWIWFRKALVAVEDCSLQHDKTRTLLASVSRIDHFVLGSGQDIFCLSTLKRPTLPLVPRQPSIWSSWLMIKRLSRTLTTHEISDRTLVSSKNGLIDIATMCLEGHPSLIGAEGLRKDCLNAISMQYLAVSSAAAKTKLSYFVDRGGDMASLMGRQLEEYQDAFRKSLDSFRCELDLDNMESQPETDAGAMDSLNTNSHFQDYGKFTKDLMKRFALVQLSSLCEWIFQRQEHQIVCLLCRDLVAHNSQRGSYPSDSLKFSISELLGEGTNCVRVSVAQLGPYQAFLWALEDQGWECLQADRFSKEAVTSMLFSSLSRVWSNPTSGLSKTSMVLEIPGELLFPTSGETGDKRKTVMMDSEENSEGDLKTATVLSLLADGILAKAPPNAASSFCTIENLEAREGQAKLLVRCLVRQPKNEVDSQAWQLLYLLKDTCEALRGSITAPQLDKLLETCRKPHQLKSSEELFLSICQSSSNPVLVSMVESVLKPILHFLQLIFSSQTPSMARDLAYVDIFLGLLRFYLGLPRSILDPGRKPMAKISLMTNQISSLQSQIAAEVLFESMTNGNPSQHSHLVEEVNQLEKKIKNQRKKVVLREASVPFSEVHREFHEFSKSFLAVEETTLLAQQVHQNEAGTVDRVKNLFTTWKAFCSRSTQAFCDYEDVVNPLISDINLVARGFMGLLKTKFIHPKIDLTKHLVSCLSFPLLDHHSLVGVPAPTTRDEWFCLQPLAFGSLFRALILSKLHGIEPSAVTLWRDTVEFLLGSVGSETFTVDSNEASTSEAVAEKLFREQFPDHREIFAISKKTEVQDESANEIEEDTRLNFSPSLSEQDVELIAYLHMTMFSQLDIGTDVRIKAFHMCYQAGARLHEAKFFEPQYIPTNDPFSAAHVLAVSLASPGCHFGPSGPKGGWVPGEFQHDFHRQPTPDETMKASGPLERLMARLGQLLSFFPGNAILSSVFKVADRVRKLDALYTSSGVLMSGLEELLKHAQDWEQHASKRVVIGEPLLEIRQLVAGLRKLELESWHSLLLMREKAFERNSLRKWIRLQSIFQEFLSSDSISNIEDQNEVDHWAPKWVTKGIAPSNDFCIVQKTVAGLFTDLVRSLDTFVLTAPMPEAQTRLRLLQSFGMQFCHEARIRDKRTPAVLSRTILSLCFFYEQFVPYLTESQLQIRRPFEEKLKNEVKLAKWDQQSYYSLAESSERNYRKLMGILNEYAEALSSTTAQVLEKQHQRGVDGKSDGGSDGAAVDIPPKELMFPLTLSHTQQSRPLLQQAGLDSFRWDPLVALKDEGDRIRKIPRYIERMENFSKEISSVGSAVEGRDVVDQICTAVFDRIESLRRKDCTRAMKERALVDLFRELKRQGFLHTKWSVPHEFRQFGEILLLPSPLAFLSGSSSGVEFVRRSEEYFQRSLSELNRLRPESSINGGAHMTSRQVEIMVGFADHGVFLTSQQRTVIAALLANIEKSSATVKLMRFEKTHLVPVNQSFLSGATKFARCFRSAVEAARQIEILLVASKHLVQHDSLLSDLSQWLEASSDDFSASEEMQMITSSHLEKITTSISKLTNLKFFLDKNRDSGFIPEPSLVHCIREVDVAIAAGTFEELQSPEPDQCGYDMVKFQRLCNDAVENALLVAQTCAKEKSAEEFVWSCHRQATNELTDLNINRLGDCCKGVVDELRSVSISRTASKETLDSCTALSRQVSCLCDRALNLARLRLEQYLSFHYGCGKLTYVLLRVFRTLISKGFCSDKMEEQEGEGDGTGAMSFEDDKDGTGMGEGEGRRDVTDEIENEEQLLGLKNDNTDNDDQTKDAGSKELDEKEAEKGMEMENDFDGEMFDVPEPDEQEQEKEDDDEKEELDREMGDDAGPNEQVVDEKLWDGSDDEDMNDQNDEKLEEDSPMNGNDKSDEMITKDKGQEEDNDKESDPQAKADGVEDHQEPLDNDIEKEASTEDFVNDDVEERKEENHGVDVRDESQEQQPDEADEAEGDDLDLDNMEIDEGASEAEEDHQSDREDDHRARTEDVEDDPNEGDGDEGGESNGEDEDLEDHPPPTSTAANLEGEAAGEEEGNDDNPDEEDVAETEPPKPLQKEDGSTGLGVSATDGADAVEEDNAEEDGEGGQTGEDMDMDEAQPDSQNEESSGPKGAGSASEGGSNISHGGESNAQTSVSENLPNPFQNLGDAEKFWHRKLNVIHRDSSADEQLETKQDEPPRDEQGAGDYEYTKQNENGTTQTLGETEEETTQSIERDDGEKLQKEEKPLEKPSRNPTTETPRNKQKIATNRRDRNDKEIDGEAMDVEDLQDQDISEGEKNDKDEDDDSTGPERDETEDDDVVGSRVVSDLSQLHVNDGSMDKGTAELSIEQDETQTAFSQNLYDEARQRWAVIHSETYALARRLCEKLRLVMEPLVASKLRGDYRTGKRINMKRVIGYIASSYRKDKIWLRRTKPAKRDYRVLVAVDDSESMKKSGMGEMALRAMATLATGMTQLEVGEIGIASFGDEMRLVHPFSQPFTHESGVNVTANFQFMQQRTRTALCVESAMMSLDECSGGDSSSLQIVFLVSDGRIERDSRATLRRLIREMLERNILMVMIIVEGNEKAKDSIVNMKEVTFVDGKPKVKQFMEDYPFPYYIVLDDMTNLPSILGDALRQWFEMLTRLQTANA